MPHALMIIFRALKGDLAQAWLWFGKTAPPDVPRVVPADTFLDEREESHSRQTVEGQAGHAG